ncbi:MAG: hypothetical protein M1826_005986 [Phylliscum demangeonii]|nr:MAG: hypothetical protein M1826_005986 [Phylliscum demangeonii]
MSLGVALQSVLYYVVACAACRKCAYRRKRQREAVVAKQRKSAFEDDNPTLYRHPSPFSTNIYWRDELALGPGPPPKRSGKDCKAGGGPARMASGGTESRAESRSSCGGDGGGGGGGSGRKGRHSAADGAHTLDWCGRHYQREDEALWGHEPERGIMASPSSTAPTDVAHPLRTPPATTYHIYRNRPLNDLHPPLVSTKTTDKSELRWMLQPPPHATIMSGKAAVGRAARGGPPPADIRRSSSGNPAGKQARRTTTEVSEANHPDPTRRPDIHMAGIRSCVAIDPVADSSGDLSHATTIAPGSVSSLHAFAGTTPPGSSSTVLSSCASSPRRGSVNAAPIWPCSHPPAPAPPATTTTTSTTRTTTKSDTFWEQRTDPGLGLPTTRWSVNF